MTERRLHSVIANIPVQECPRCKIDMAGEFYLRLVMDFDGTTMQCLACEKFVHTTWGVMAAKKEVNEEMLANCYWRPGGPGFLEAMASFNTHNR